MAAEAMMVSELMRQPLLAVEPGATVAEVMALAATKRVHHVPIVKGNKLLGIVCTCDLRDAEPGLRALQLARRNVVTATPDRSASEAARLMLEKDVGSVVIENGDGLWGIVTRADLARFDAALAALLFERRCSDCGATEHLRRESEVTIRCASCAARASSTHWFDRACSEETAGG